MKVFLGKKKLSSLYLSTVVLSYSPDKKSFVVKAVFKAGTYKFTVKFKGSIHKIGKQHILGPL